jgi:hypothetical protein
VRPEDRPPRHSREDFWNALRFCQATMALSPARSTLVRPQQAPDAEHQRARLIYRAGLDPPVFIERGSATFMARRVLDAVVEHAILYHDSRYMSIDARLFWRFFQGDPPVAGPSPEGAQMRAC